MKKIHHTAEAALDDDLFDGMTIMPGGARLAMTATEQPARTGGDFAPITLCIGVGQGIAMLIEKV